MSRKRWLLLALPLLSFPILYATLGSARSPSPRLGGRQHPLLPPPRLAYLISGGPGDGPRIQRLLRALYHPWNYYLVGVTGDEDRADLEAFVRAEEAPRRYGNVRVAAPGEWAAASRRGPTELAATLHGAALLLKEFQGWTWFINLSASDYPLMPQDDLLHIFSYLPRDLNFIEHTSNIGWKEHQMARPIIVDPALQISNKTEVVITKILVVSLILAVMPGSVEKMDLKCYLHREWQKIQGFLFSSITSDVLLQHIAGCGGWWRSSASCQRSMSKH